MSLSFSERRICFEQIWKGCSDLKMDGVTYQELVAGLRSAAHEDAGPFGSNLSPAHREAVKMQAADLGCDLEDWVIHGQKR